MYLMALLVDRRGRAPRSLVWPLLAIILIIALINDVYGRNRESNTDARSQSLDD